MNLTTDQTDDLLIPHPTYDGTPCHRLDHSCDSNDRTTDRTDTTPIQHPDYTDEAKIIHDHLYGDVPMSHVAIRLIDTPLYRRLSDIRQTSMAWRVFPAAQHSRLNHQVGVYGLSHQTLDSLVRRKKLIISNTCEILSSQEMVQRIAEGDLPRISHEEAEWICLGGLLHDLGHGPASHTFDDLIESLIEEGHIPTDCVWRTHEERSQYMFRELVAKEPDRFGLTEDAVDYICNVINPPADCEHDFRFQFINNEINGVDLDKIDYLERDRYVFGLSDHIDIKRLIDNSSICSGPIALDEVVAESGVVGAAPDTCQGTYWTFGERTRDDIFALFMTRYKLYRNIYNHPKIVKFELAYTNVLRSNVEDIVDTFMRLDTDSFAEMTDSSMLWRAEDTVRREFGDRNTFRLIPETDIECAAQGIDVAKFKSIVRFDQKVGFFGKSGFNPFIHIRFHDRTTNRIVRLAPTEINIFLGFNCTGETLRYRYGYNGSVPRTI